MPALATTGGRQHLVVLHAAPPSAGNWQQQLLPRQDSGLSPGQKIDKELAQPSALAPPAPAPTPAVALERTYRSAGGWAEQTCSVCLSELADGDIVRVLIACRHCFHTACVEPWLHERDTCALCRAPTTTKGWL
ncbi:RING-H2 finger protein ATL79-like [Miscanthus floridulus]|uniref:RING-H2 finger protein ATL79-like n=1 Tax=Miscanthus floridulus TaxID=154761 RepID=UPI003458974D